MIDEVAALIARFAAEHGGDASIASTCSAPPAR